MTYTIADLHLSLGTDKSMEKFGGRWMRYTEKIDRRWRALVGESDSVILPGDISWAMHLPEAAADLTFIDSLPGTKYFVRGNHDCWWSSLSKMNALLESLGLRSIRFIQNNAAFTGDIIAAGSRGWYVEPRLQSTAFPTDYERIVSRECIRIAMSLDCAQALSAELGGNIETVLFLHFPPVFGDFICRPIVDLIKKYGVRRCYFGHIHHTYNIPRTTEFEGVKFTLCSADFLDFSPLPVE